MWGEMGEFFLSFHASSLKEKTEQRNNRANEYQNNVGHDPVDIVRFYKVKQR
jgi:hypothetical protein